MTRNRTRSFRLRGRKVHVLRPALVLFITAFVLGCVPGFGQNVPARDQTALSLLQQCSTASGVDAGLVPDIVAEGSLIPANAKSPSGSLVLKSKGFDQARAEYTFGAKQEVHVVNRGRGFAVRENQKSDLALHLTQYSRPEHLPGVLCTVDMGRPNVEIKYVGVESVRGTSAHHILFQAVAPPIKNAESLAEAQHLFDPLISNFELFLDTQTLLVVKTSTFAFSPDAIQNRSVWETYYSDYRRVGATVLPYRMEHYIAGSKLDEVTFSSIRTDIAVSANDFESQ